MPSKEPNLMKNLTPTRRTFITVALIWLASFYIIGSSFLGVNGAHEWRQSDVLSQIYGFLNYKHIPPIHNFLLQTRVYDLPIYEYLIAVTSKLTFSPPLVVTRYFDFFFFTLFLSYSFLLLERIKRNSGLIFSFLITTSPLFLHFFSVPLPDTMSIALSMCSTYLFWRHPTSKLYLPVTLLLFSIAALIKSPIPFLFLVFIFFSYTLKLPDARSNIALAILLSCSLLVAVSAELIRRHLMHTDVDHFAQPPTWYFGTIHQRLTTDFWIRLGNRTLNSFSYREIGYALLTVTGIIQLIGYFKSPTLIKFALPTAGAFFAGWLVFSNLYFIHNYYDMDAFIFLYILISVSLASITELHLWALPRARLVSYFSYTIPLIASILIIYMPKDSNFNTKRFLANLHFLTKNATMLTLVNDPTGGPSIGGYAETPFRRVSLRLLNEHCEYYLRNSQALLVRGSSDCLSSHKAQATIYFHNKSWQYFLNRNFVLSDEHPVPSSRPLPAQRLAIDTKGAPYFGKPSNPFTTYFSKNTLFLKKQHCVTSPPHRRFFVHAFSEDSTKPKNLDFDPRGHIYFKQNGSCVIFRRIPRNASLLRFGQFTLRKNKNGRRVCCRVIWASKLKLRN